MTDRIEGGLDILRREAKGCRPRHRNWKTHAELMRRAREHVTVCGGDWLAYESVFSRELADLLGI